MGRTALAEGMQPLERGGISFLYRPRVEELEPASADDIQRILLLLAPTGSPFERLIAVGRKAIPPSVQHERFWGFVDLVLAPYDMQMALGAQVYGTKTRGVRHLPAARAFASGSYEVASHGEHSHLQWHVDHFSTTDPVAAELTLERDADYIVTIANPDPAAWGIDEAPDLQAELFDELEIHVTVPTPFPPALQRRFRGRRFVQLDSSGWLDHPGAELVFLGVGT